MFKVLISSTLAKILKYDFTKIAANDDWRDRYVTHITPGGKTTKVKIRSLPPEEQAKYAPKKTQPHQLMTIPQIQSEVKTFQQTQSRGSFKKLYNQFLPMIMGPRGIVNKVVGERRYIATAQDIEDLKQNASYIFVKALKNADPSNQGIVAYIYTTVLKQLQSKAREIFRSLVSIDPKDRRLLRAIHAYIHDYRKKHGTDPIDYEQMAKELNDPKNEKYERYGISHATPNIISDLLQSGAVSMEEQIDEGEDDRSVHDVLGPEQVSPDATGFMPTPEDVTTESELKKVISDSISAINDPVKEKILKMRYGLMSQEQLPKEIREGDEMSVREIADALSMPKSTVKRELDRAESRMRQMKNVKKLKASRAISRIIKSYNKHIRFAYVPDTVTKISKNAVLIDDRFLVKKFANQLVCDCGKDCFHKSAAKQWLR